MAVPTKNWAGNQRCLPKQVHEPRFTDEVAAIVRAAAAAGERVKVIGGAHSFTDTAMTDGHLLSLDAMNQVLSFDGNDVTMQAGIRLRDLNERLARRGLALPNLGDINVQSIAGATSTATHGTGVDFPNLATNIVGLEIVTGDGSDLTVVSLQRWADDAVHLGQHDALVGRDARLKHVVVSLGGKVVRLNTNVRYAGPGGDATLLGVYFADAGQHLEHRSFVDHEAPKCTSLVTYKGALQGDTARTVWVGDVLIRATAEGTSTYELNRNLVLTDGGRADSVPNLEIETGQIEGAGHASATGRFDDEQLFYLQARGIPEVEARRLVVRGFFADVVAQIGVPDVQELLMAAIEDELAGAMLHGAAGKRVPG